MKFKSLTPLVIALLMSTLSACDVDKTQEGEMPEVDVDVKEGQMPKYDVDAPDVDVSTKEKEVKVPDVDVDVDMEKKTITVPDVDVDMPADDDK